MLNSYRFNWRPSTEDIVSGPFVVRVLSEEVLRKDLTKQTVAERSVKLLWGEEEEKKIQTTEAAPLHLATGRAATEEMSEVMVEVEVEVHWWFGRLQ